jgi:hypothetical protein
MSFRDCKFVGTTTYAFPGCGRHYRFDDCLFVGDTTIGNDEGFTRSEAPKISRCLFTDDPAMSPTGAVYLGTSGTAFFESVNDQKGALFSECHFKSVNAGQAAPHGGTFRDCTFELGTENDFAFGMNLLGVTEIVKTSGTTNILNTGFGLTPKLGSNITYNGADQRRASATFDPPSLASGASATTTVSIPWARIRDRVSVTFTQPLQGVRLWGYVSTGVPEDGTGSPPSGGVVTAVFENFTGGTVDLASGTLEVAVCDPDLP